MSFVSVVYIVELSNKYFHINFCILYMYEYSKQFRNNRSEYLNITKICPITLKNMNFCYLCRLLLFLICVQVVFTIVPKTFMYSLQGFSLNGVVFTIEIQL